MNSQFIKKGIILATFAGAILAPSDEVSAADITLTVPKQSTVIEVSQNTLNNVVAELNNNTTIENTIKIESIEEMQFNAMFSGKAFAIVGEKGYLLVTEAADEKSDWIGKIYEGSLLQVIERGEEWTEITCGNVAGFVKTENLITGKDAVAKAKEILTEKYSETDFIALDEETIEDSFTTSETKEEEEARIAAEEAKRKAEEEARIAAEKAALKAKGQSVVDYAKQFIGNPYVWGGTSLTNGADCSGFVLSVYKHFGYSLPRTSTAMRSVGKAVSYSEILPGDIVCYEGHVGIYAGNGQIVNAINSAKGIGMSSATYKDIITIRRLY